jgi:flavin-dependent dehydrogenase
VTHDLIVLGSGIAGSTVAIRLGAAGRRVALVGGESRQGWEGLSARSRALLLGEGVTLEALSAAAAPRRGRWAERTVEGQEWIVERSHLAAVLRANAVSAGAQRFGSWAHAIHPWEEGWRVHLRDGRTLAAPWLIDARGRRGAERRGPLLLAVSQAFHRSHETHETHIEAFDSGWCWWAQHGRRLWVQVTRRPRQGHPGEWLAQAAAQLPALAEALGDAQPDGELKAYPAHARLRLGLPHSRLWRVGDAALAIDPLSGQGVHEALRGAQLVATALVSVFAGGDAALAHRFVTERQAQAFEQAVRTAAGFYRENQHRGHFWRDTAVAYEELLSPARLDAVAQVESRPVLIEGRIELREVLVTAQHPRGVWHVDGVPLAPLLRHLNRTTQATVDSAARFLDRSPREVASAIRWLQQCDAAPQTVSSRNHAGG